jgi:alpha-L-rhamnosidase
MAKRGFAGRDISVAAVVAFGLTAGTAWAGGPAAHPAALQVDSLVEPLGVDTAQPVLSWQLRDGSLGAKQTAYEVLVSSHAGPGAAPDVWDSGKVASSKSLGVAYAGPALKASTRYYWRVRVWGADGKAYPVSAPSWWETGLMGQENWRGQWIGYEDAELHSLRESGAQWITNTATVDGLKGDTQHDFRYRLVLDKPVERAVLYTTGQDTAAAWVNGTQMLKAQPLTPWSQMPWGTYVHADVTTALRSGTNMVAIGVTRYKIGDEKEVPAKSPMSACIYVVFRDGTTELVKTGAGEWKAMLNGPEGWWGEQFDDHAWPDAVEYKDADGSTDEAIRPWPTGAVAALRHTFDEKQRVVSARLYATALGAYAFRLNGGPVGDEVMAPGWMDFREHVPYQVYDVTKQVRQGENAIAAYLAPGWYSTPLMWFRRGNNYGATQPALLAQLRIEHADGSVEWIATDASWKAADSPILKAEIYDGETHDARRQLTGWDMPGNAGGDWKPAMVVHPVVPKVIAQYFQPIRHERVMQVKAITNPAPGVYIFDFGQNMAAVPHLRVSGPRGEDIRLRFGEVLNPDGTLYTENLRTAKATDHFILAGKGVEEFEPQFTFHGFRYAEITGMQGRPTAATLQAVVLHTDAPFTTQLSTGDAMVNQLWSNVLWGQRSNFVGLPTDCPQRDERLGWSADAQVFWRTAAYDMDLTTFTQKFAADLQGTQQGTPMYGIFAPGVTSENPGHGAGWSDAGVIIPWTGWMQSGNTKVIDESWDGMQAYLARIEEENPNHLWRKDFGAAFGDWLTPTITTPEDLVATAYWAYDASLMRDMALATGRTADAQKYGAMFAQIKAAFEKAYVKKDGFVGAADTYASIPPPTAHPVDATADTSKPVETQTGYVLALHMHLLPEQLRKAAGDRLVAMIQENHGLLGTGFLGTPYLLEVLTDTGHSDVAYQLLLNKQYPSWGYLIAHGATTTWERWNGDAMRGDPSMNSYNHYAYGAVAEWLYRYAAGVDTEPDAAGFSTVYLHPNFDKRLGRMTFAYDSPYGKVQSNWVLTGDSVQWTVVIPPNATALLTPAMLQVQGLKVNGVPLERARGVTKAEGEMPGSYRLPSGTFAMSMRLASGPDSGRRAR